MRLTTLLMAFSLCACATIERPNVDAMIVNAPGKKRCGYNLKNDYNSDGKLKAGAKAHCRRTTSIDDLNKAMLVEAPPEKGVDPFPDGLARLKTYIRRLRQEYERQLEECRGN